jgi:lipase chaperone LimK
MTKLLDEAVATVRELPESVQDIAARFLLGFASPHARQFHLSDDQLAEVELAKREVRERKIASDEEMADVWRRFGL